MICIRIALSHQQGGEKADFGGIDGTRCRRYLQTSCFHGFVWLYKNIASGDIFIQHLFVQIPQGAHFFAAPEQLIQAADIRDMAVLHDYDLIGTAQHRAAV